MKKILVIGAGHVGAHIINHGITKHIGAEFFLLDLNQELEAAQILDLKDTLLFSHHAQVSGVNFEDPRLKEMDVIIITAGANQAPGETRCDLLQKNTTILQSIAKQLGTLKPEAIVILVTNPVDILTQAAQQIFDLPDSQIFGTGTLLDSARLRWRLAEKMGININHIHGYVLGEHGDSEFVAWSSVRPKPEISEAEKNKIEDEVKKAAYTIIEGKGATYFGIAAAAIKLLNAIINDTKELLPVSTPCHFIADETLKNTPIGIPAVIGSKGIERVPSIELTKDEHDKLIKSAQKIQDLFNSCPL
ncbi:hypothetical protein GW756_04420 [bacterium]|nr:hypothetical protein [bacterium]NCQ55155.1 hypothetical protein [Candidatus Parcubacteria bacterium]NCS67332.1 hypothetical protein [Candidatus Peregrinibacteria bacterium]NCS96587.1 hypothetical protein [bacterium]